MRTYLFLRHAQALHQTRTLQPSIGMTGGIDWPLTERGRAQAAATGATLRHADIQRVVSSQLLRARQTAEHIACAAGVPYDHAWAELDEIPPRTLRRGAAGRPEWLEGMLGAWRVHRHARGARREIALADVEGRIREVLARLDAMNQERIAIVSHGYWILLMALLVPGRFRLRWIANCSVTRVDALRAGAYRLVSFAQPPEVVLAPEQRIVMTRPA
jgi:broad specificity phosphatase PhoE